MSRQIRLLAVAAHPDDAELGAGGILSAGESNAAHILNVTSGEAAFPSLSSDFVKQVREREAENAARVLNASVSFLRFPDAALGNTLELVKSLVKRIRDIRPEIIVTHSITQAHPDHKAVGQAVSSAAFWSSVPSYEPGVLAHEVDQVLCWEQYDSQSFEPTTFVDISESFPTKLQALSCYKLVAETLTIPIRYAKACNSLRGVQANVEYAEAFSTTMPTHLRDIRRLI